MPRASKRPDTQVLVGNAPPARLSAYLLVGPGTPDERRIALGEQPLTIGTDDDCQVQLVDKHVSRRHAEVTRVAAGVLVRDLGSRNGTYVEGNAVKEVTLKNGALLSVGLTQIKCVLESLTTESLPEGEGPDHFGLAVGSSPATRKVFALLARLAPTELSITLLGETGSGKDILARSVHAESARKDRDFVVFDCGAAAPTLIESELFGHEKGAFTGADAARQGAFERAHGGTLFLDEVGELALELQPKLLRALDQGTVRRVGGARDLPVDVRVIAATHRNIEEDVRKGKFREDLFFRLAAAIVAVPPLRARRADLPELAKSILAADHPALEISDAVLEILKSYDWPGNVRELKNVLAGAAAMADGAILEPRHLIFFRPRRRDPTIDKLPLAGRSLESIEKAAIEQTLRHEGGNRAKAAKALGIAASTLYEKLKKYQLV